MNDKYPKITGNTPEESLAVLLRSVQSKDARIGQLEAQVKALGGDPYHGLFQTVSDAPLTLSASTEWIMHPPSEKARAWLGLPPDASTTPCPTITPPANLTFDMIKDAFGNGRRGMSPDEAVKHLQEHPEIWKTMNEVAGMFEEECEERFAPPASEDGSE